MSTVLPPTAVLLIDITHLSIADGDITIDAAGRIRGCKKVIKCGEQAKIGNGTFSGNTLRVNNSIMTGGSLMVNNNNSFSPNGCVLDGSEHTPIRINGLAATFGEFIAAYRYAHNRPDFLAATQPRPAPAEIFILSPAIKGRIKHISVEGCGKLLSIDASWLANTLTVHATGSATIQLPQKTFEFLTATAAGSADIKGARDAGTRASMGTINATGSADITQLYITISGNVMASGSADVSIYAANRDAVLKSQGGSADIKIRQRNVTPPPPPPPRSTQQHASSSAVALRQEPRSSSSSTVTIIEEGASRKRKHEVSTSATTSNKREKREQDTSITSRKPIVVKKEPVDSDVIVVENEPEDDDEVVILSPTNDDSAWD